MGAIIYQLYFTFQGSIIFTFISYLLYTLCKSKRPVSCRLYVLFSFLGFFILQRIIDWFITDLLKKASPYCVFLLSLGVAALFSSFIFLQSSAFQKITYLLFILTFIQLYKIVLSPLYELENSLTPHTYAFIDFMSGNFLFFLLGLLCVFFHKLQIAPMTSGMPKKLFLILYFPISILLTTLITSNTSKLWTKFAPILALIIITNLPIIYYFFSRIISSYEQEKQLNAALQETKAQLSHYRYSIVLQDEIRKERHELKNKYFYIQTLVHEKKFEQLEDYLNHAIGKKLSSFEEIQTGNTLMDYILNQKIQTCRKNNIKVFSEILIPEQLNISEDTLCTILLNLLDNAITASLHEPDADIHISIRCVQKYLVCKIKNKCSYNVLEQNPNLATTKQDITHHGFGIKIIRETVEKNNGILNFNYNDHYFTATVMLEL